MMKRGVDHGFPLAFAKTSGKAEESSAPFCLLAKLNSGHMPQNALDGVFEE